LLEALLDKKLMRSPSQPIAGHSSMYLSSQLQGSKQQYYSPGWLGINMRPNSKTTKAKRARGIAQVVECLPSKYKPELNPQHHQKQKQKQKQNIISLLLSAHH
jgi:hypothetical protein